VISRACEGTRRSLKGKRQVMLWLLLLIQTQPPAPSGASPPRPNRYEEMWRQRQQAQAAPTRAAPEPFPRPSPERSAGAHVLVISDGTAMTRVDYRMRSGLPACADTTRAWCPAARHATRFTVRHVSKLLCTE
jgi:hypothetical protein